MTYEEKRLWLDSLKPGDKVVLNTRRLQTFGGRMGLEVYTIVKIPPKRSKFTLEDKDGHHIEVKGHGDYVVGSGWNRHHYSMQPYTPEVEVKIRNDTALLLAKKRAWEMSEALSAFEKKAMDLDLEPNKIEEFFEVSSKLFAFLKNYKEKKP